jgi:sn-glycerol 3-phosphate transport system substrate-binding protein
MLQVFEVGTATMMSAKGAIVPVAKVMTDAKEQFDPKAYLPTVTGYYSDQKGNMLSFPFNSSTVMFYINKDAFKKAGLDPEKAPKTWKEVVAAAEKLKASGHKCPYTTSWPSWMHIENFSAWHNVPIGTKQNGMGGLDTVFTINSPLHVRHIAMLGDMSKKGLFTYAGRTNQGDAKFSSGECAMFSGSAGAQAASRRPQPSSGRSTSSLTMTTSRARRRIRSSAALRSGSWAARSPRNTGAWRNSWRSCRGRISRWTGTPPPATCRLPRLPTT